MENELNKQIINNRNANTRSADVPSAVSGTSRPDDCTRSADVPSAVSGMSRPDDSIRSADVPSAVSGTSRPDYNDVRIRNRGCLPHWEINNGIYFITFQLADSLPMPVIEQIKLDLMKNQNNLSENKKRISMLYHHRIEKYLDSSQGECHLANQQIAELTANAIRYFNGERYQIYAWCIMPNHVHVVIQPFGKFTLAKIMQSWKGFTAKEANKIIGRTGTFWQREYYDHLVRNENDLVRVIRYVKNNPVKANLVDWKWVWVDEELTHVYGTGRP